MARKNVLTQGKKAKANQLALENRLEEARALFASVCSTDPIDVEAWVKLSITQGRLGQSADAEASGRRAVRLAPGTALAHHALAFALQCQGKHEEAIFEYAQAIERQPDYPDSHFLLGSSLMAIGNLQDAERSLRRALALRPNFFEALSDLGALLLNLNQLEEANVVLQRALLSNPRSLEVMANLGSLKEQLGAVDEALACYRSALRLHPESADVHAKLGELLERMGRADDAQQVVARGLTLAPHHPLLNLVAARLDRRAGQYAGGVVRLDAVLNRPMPQITRSEIHLLLGQLHDLLGQSDRALPNFCEGKRGIALAADPDGRCRTRFLQRVAQIRGWLGLDVPLPEACFSLPTEASPIFLIGFPRSGTTLLEQILDSHPALVASEEKPMVAAMEQAFLQMTGGDAGALHQLTTSQIEALRAIYFREAERHVQGQDGRRLVDKLPLNIVDVPLLWRVFPQARFILAIRHPCDVVLSCLMQSFGHNDAMAGFVSLESIAEIYARVMEAWLEDEKRLPLHWHTIRYEDLIGDIEAQTRPLFDFLGLAWSAEVLEHTRHAQQQRAIKTPSYHQVTQPIYQHAKYRWKRYERELLPVMATLRPFIEHFGYGETRGQN